VVQPAGTQAEAIGQMVPGLLASLGPTGQQLRELLFHAAGSPLRRHAGQAEIEVLFGDKRSPTKGRPALRDGSALSDGSAAGTPGQALPPAGAATPGSAESALASPGASGSPGKAVPAGPELPAALEAVQKHAGDVAPPKMCFPGFIDATREMLSKKKRKKAGDSSSGSDDDEADGSKAETSAEKKKRKGKAKTAKAKAQAKAKAKAKAEAKAKGEALPALGKTVPAKGKAKAKGKAVPALCVAKAKAKAHNSFVPATVWKTLDYPGTSKKVKVHWGPCTIYTSLAEQQWRLKPAKGQAGRVDQPYSWKRDKPESVWRRLAADVRQLAKKAVP